MSLVPIRLYVTMQGTNQIVENLGFTQKTMAKNTKLPRVKWLFRILVISDIVRADFLVP